MGKKKGKFFYWLALLREGIVIVIPLSSAKREEEEEVGGKELDMKGGSTEDSRDEDVFRMGGVDEKQAEEE